LKLYQYDDIKKLNQALGSFAKNNVPVIKVDIVRVSKNILEYFILADPKEVFKMPVITESTRIIPVKKEIKVKKEKSLKTK
jgi:hypothetical protein